jgi:cysteine desulfuration protein SufE
MGQLGQGADRDRSLVTAATTAGLPPKLAAIVTDFAEVSPPERLQLLLELAGDLPPLPAEYAERRDSLEQVDECQSPLFLAVRVGADRAVHLVFDAPAEAPTTRGFAGILYEGLNGVDAEEVLAVPDNFYLRLGLAEAVSPLRLRGMAALLGRLKRQVREQAG